MKAIKCAVKVCRQTNGGHRADLCRTARCTESRQEFGRYVHPMEGPYDTAACSRRKFTQHSGLYATIMGNRAGSIRPSREFALPYTELVPLAPYTSTRIPIIEIAPQEHFTCTLKAQVCVNMSSGETRPGAHSRYEIPSAFSVSPIRS